MSTVTPEDIANVCKLLERLRTGEVNLIPSLASIDQRDPNGKSEAMLLRVEELLSEHLLRMQEPTGDGGQAFPITAGDYHGSKHGNGAGCGMTLRDYFAAKAMAALVGNPVFFERYGFSKDNAEEASFAYAMADAMLKQRSAP